MNHFGKKMALILSAAMVTGLLAGCGKGVADDDTKTAQSVESSNQSQVSETTQQTEEMKDADERELLEDGMTYATGLPITKEVVEIDVVILDSQQYPDLDQTSVWDWVEEQTNIRLNVTTAASAENTQLMYTSRDYPDMFMLSNVPVNLISDAAEAGDIVELEPLLDKYAPTWSEFFDEEEVAYTSALINGKLYSLPYADYAPWTTNLRDVMYINKTWLDELNLEVPTTTEQLKDVLVAFKDNAGKGSIPENVLPYHFIFNSWVSGQYDIYGQFGAYMGSSDYLYVDDGVVQSQAINPLIKEPLKYLNELYELGVIKPEVFTDNWNSFTARLGAETLNIGVYSNAGAGVPPEGYVAFGPLDSGNGETPLLRAQTKVATSVARNAVLTKENEYPEATVRLLDWIVSDMTAQLNVTYGMQGVFWDYNAEGKAEYIITDYEVQLANSMDQGTGNYFIGMRNDAFYENYVTANLSIPYSREWSYVNMYEGKTMSSDNIFVGGTLSDDEQAELSVIAADIAAYRNSMLAGFITGEHDVDAEWDTYVAEMKRLGIDRYVELKQIAWDLIH